MPETCICISLDEGERYDRFAARYFQECLFSTQVRASFYVGMSSLVFWVLCMVPQIIKHYKRQSCEGIAGMLLAFWLFGDSLNLLGSVLTHQLAFQKVSATVFVCMDLCMIFQFFYYGKRASSAVIAGSNQTPLLAAALLVACALPAPAFAQNEDVVVELIPRCDPEPVDGASTAFLLGSALGWVSTACYLSSRLSQIYSNYQRLAAIRAEAEAEEDGAAQQHEEHRGPGMTMFLFAICANLLYSLGILLNFHIKALPWLMGSLAVMFLDCIIVWQEQQASGTFCSRR